MPLLSTLTAERPNLRREVMCSSVQELLCVGAMAELIDVRAAVLVGRADVLNRAHHA